MNKIDYTVVDRQKMSNSARKIRDFYAIKPDAPIYQKEFGYYVLDKWTEQGYLKPRAEGLDYQGYLNELFMLDTSAINNLGGLGWCEAGLYPKFEEKILEDRGEYELVLDFAGRHVLYFKNRRSGFMPEYVDHPVKDMKTWEENIKWRMNPKTEGRLEQSQTAIDNAVKGSESGNAVVQQVVGGYMYLRSLMGPEELLYQFYDAPELIHDCMKTWFELADSVIAHHQKSVSLDEVFFGEDICYNGGSLISPEMMQEFLIPYYQQLYTNIKNRNLDKQRAVHFQIDTDGYCHNVIPIYKAIGCDYMSPFEVASHCDVVEIAKQYPDLRVSGGIDKRILASTKEEIDRHLEAIMPYMRKRGGFIPTCDHGVPEEVPFENYMHYRKKMNEYCK